MLNGGCFCGRVRYEVSKPLLSARSCHCSRCRKAFSGSGSAYAEVAPESFSWTLGEANLTRFESAPGWGLAFCSTCGTTLCGMNDGAVHGVTLGSVDGDPGVRIDMHIFVGSKAPWDHIGGNAPQFAEFPSATDQPTARLDPEAEAEHIRELERSRLRALVGADLETCRRLHHPDFQLITPIGQTLSKDQYLDAVAGGDLRYVMWEPGPIDVRVHDGVALIRYTARLEVAAGGQPSVPFRCRHTDTYEKHGGQWQVVWSQATSIR
jgi:hypothetical protein